MWYRSWIAFALIASGTLVCGPGSTRADTASIVLRQMTAEGRLKEGVASFEERIKDDPKDQEARFALGILKFIQAVEGLASDQYRFGLGTGIREQVNIPLFHEILDNPKPQKVRYEDVRAMLLRFSRGLADAERTLAGIETADVKLEFRPGVVRLDINGDGHSGDDESLWKLFIQVNPAVRREEAEQFVIQADGGDVHWLRGYCHFLMALCDFTAAYDYRELFVRCGHLLYPDVETLHTWIKDERKSNDVFRFRNLADYVAAIHLVNFDVLEPVRMEMAHAHLLSMIEQSRESWKRIEAETDDDAEWLPNPRQKNSAIGMPVNTTLIEGWQKVLDEVEAILNGRKLVPFWRGDVEGAEEAGRGLGVNLKKVFLKPERFDLVMWVSGTGAQPYLEEGELSTQESWDRLTRVFGGEFFGFAVWFN